MPSGRLQPVINGEKLCTSCMKMLQVSMFRKRPDTKVGLMSWCKTCKREKSDSIRVRRYKPESETATKEQISARQAVRDAVRKGRIYKPEICQSCQKKTTRRNLHGHHANGYENKLDVIWLCPQCHSIEHEKIRCNSQINKSI